MSQFFHSKFRFCAYALPALGLLFALGAVAGAEETTPASSNTVSASAPVSGLPSATSSVSSSADGTTADSLPEAPQPAPAAAPFSFQGKTQTSTGGTAPKFSEAIPSGWTAQHLSAGDKVILGFRNVASPTAVAGVILGAGYAHITDGQPNYGVDGDAFAQRFGAGMARSASQSIFTTSILSPLLHQDTRYYVLGPQANFFHRILYAATRPIISKTDSGHATINASLLIGYAGAAALTRTYYPPINRNFQDEARTYGSSLGGAAIGFAVDEFADQLLKAVHMHH